MTQSDVSDMAFTPTQDMIERHERWLDKYTQGILDGWIKQGLEPGDPDAAIALQAIREEMRVPERPQWMEPQRALGVLAMWDHHNVPNGMLNYRDAIRTRAGMRDEDWVHIVAKSTGVTVKHLTSYTLRNTVGIEYGQGETTYLYRCFDSEGNLLYIGITKSIPTRMEEHKWYSAWWPYLDRYELEEISSRKEAFRAETEAIHAELPIFNKIASRRSGTDAVHYVMSRSSLEPDTLF